MKRAVLNIIKRTSVVLLLLASGIVTAQTSDASSVGRRPKVGLVLSGGGAKGAAHIGVLKYMEEVGIPIDYIAGTSMGSIVGGFRALGYEADQLDEIVRQMDWNAYLSNEVSRSSMWLGDRNDEDTYLMSLPFDMEGFLKIDNKTFLSSLPSGFIKGNSLVNLFNSMSLGYQDSIDFDSLPIPFACVATNVYNGKAVVMRNGNLPLAIRSSMAIPGVFAPVYHNKQILVDGGLVDNFPVELCKKMGADIIIGVNVGDSLLTEYDQLQSLPQLLWQYSTIAMQSHLDKALPYLDIYIEPDMTSFNSLSFSSSSIDTIIQRGYDMAARHREEFEALRKLLEESSDEPLVQHYQAPAALRFDKDTLLLKSVSYKGVGAKDAEWLMSHDNLIPGDSITKPLVDQLVERILGSGYYEDLTYSIYLEEGDKSDSYRRCSITFRLSTKAPHNFSAGLRVDSEENTSLLVHIGLNQHRPTGWGMMADLKVSLNPTLELRGLLKHSRRGQLALGYKLGLSHFGMGHNYNNSYSNINVTSSNLSLSHMTQPSSNNRLRYGADIEFLNFDLSLEENSSIFDQLVDYSSSPFHWGLFGEWNNDNFDDGYFPTRGHSLLLKSHWRRSTAESDINYASSSPYLGFLDFTLIYQKSISLSKRLAFIPSYYRRVILGHHKSLYNNLVGGVQMGRYLEHQLPFIGFNTPQRVYDATAIVRMDWRYKLTENQYLTLIGNMMLTGDIEALGQDEDFDYYHCYGVGLRYSYRLPYVGPLSLDIHWSNLTKRVGLFFNLGYMF